MCPFLSVFLAASTSCTECPSAENITNSLRLVVSGMRHSVAQEKKRRKNISCGELSLLENFRVFYYLGFQKNKNILNIFAISQTQGHFYYTVFLPGNSEKSLFIHCLFKKKIPSKNAYRLQIHSTRSGAQSGRLHNANKAKVLSGCLFLFFFSAD